MIERGSDVDEDDYDDGGDAEDIGLISHSMSRVLRCIAVVNEA